MELDVMNYIRKKIVSNKPSLKDLIESVSLEFEADLVANDVSFITENYRLILMEFWVEEVVEKVEKKTNSGEIGDNEIIELLYTFKSLKAFYETPEKLQGEVYKLITNEIKIFKSNDFYKPRREICNVLNHKLMNSGRNILNEYKFFENLIEVLRNSYKNFEEVVNKLDIQSFINGEITVYKVARNVLANNFSIENYGILRSISEVIENKHSTIENIFKKEIEKFLVKLISKEFESGGKKILLLQRKIMTSLDLNAAIGSDVNEIQVVCDTLHIDDNLLEKYRGKNLFVMSNTIRLHQESTWDLSGYDAPQNVSTNAGQNTNGDGKNGIDGQPGESGGNCEIFSAEIKNGGLWTIISNGGNASSGQNGGNGENGVNGQDVQKEDFKLNGEKITNSNFLTILNNYGISTEIGSRRCNIFENNLEKQIIFNRNSTKSELLMLIKGTSGTTGALGGFSGVRGFGGVAGKINVNCDDKGYKVVTNDGKDGTDGVNGLNGRFGCNGRDAYVQISSDENNPKYGGLDKRSRFEIILSSTDTDFSIFYKQFGQYFGVAEKLKVVEPAVAFRNTPEYHGHRLALDENTFYELMTSFIRNSNKNLEEVIKKFKIRQFINQAIDFKEFASAILENSFETIDYNILRSYAKLYTQRPLELETQLRDYLRNFTKDAKIVQKSQNTYKIVKKLITSDDLNKFSHDFEELHVVCDTLHINSNLSEIFRGRNLAINADIIDVHKNVEWNLSGSDNFLQIQANCSGTKYFKNGGKCIISANIINNSSMLKIISNGGNASHARDGIDVTIDDFKINGQSVEDLSYPIKKTYNEGGLVKHLIKESNSNYLLLVKGSNAVYGYNGIGENGGLAGFIEVNVAGNSQNYEIEIFCENGNSDVSHDGRDAFLHVNNGQKQYIGLDIYNRYDLMSSENSLEYSIEFSSKFYYPKFSREINVEIGADSLGKSLYENIIWVLRNSRDRFDIAVTKLNLQRFVNAEISLNDVARNIEPNPLKFSCSTRGFESRITNSSDLLDIPNYSDLKNSAKYFVRTSEEGTIREKIGEFLEPAKIINSSGILTIKKKIYSSSDLNSLSINSDTTEIRLICDTLYIDSELPQNFRSRNFAIHANYVHVNKNVKWILSGAINTNYFSSNAGQQLDGIGRDGDDGTAGNSGGNFSLHCKFVENSSALTIESNGSDGTDGQNGGNGKNGENGRNASDSSFIRNEVEFKANFLVGNKNIMYGAFNLAVKNQAVVTTSDGLLAYVFVQESLFEDYGLMLMKGNKGTPGKEGGLPGHGGQGGHPGEIKIETTQYQNAIEVLSPVSGIDGKFGSPGLSGIHGKEGDDNYRFDWRNYSSKDFGKNEGKKFKLHWDDKSETHSVWDYQKKKYVSVKFERPVHTYSNGNQNTSKVTRKRAFHALSKKCASINMDAIMNESSKYLSDSRLKTQKVVSKQEASRFDEFSSFRTSVIAMLNTHKSYFQTYSFKISTVHGIKIRQHSRAVEPTKKSDIQTEAIVAQYTDYVKSEKIDIEEITRKYSGVKLEMEQTQTQIEISVQVSFEPKKEQDLDVKKSTFSDSSRILYSEVLDMLLTGCKANELFKMIRASRFHSKKYKYLGDNISGYKIEQTPRYIHDKREILSKGIEEYVKIHGKDEKSSEVQKFYNLQLKNDPEWKKCSDNAEVLKSFIAFLREDYPAFLLNFFKNLMQGSNIEAVDLEKICEDKFSLVFFREIYSKMIKKDTKTQESSVSFETNRRELWNQLPFLKDTEDFLSDSYQINRHFKDSEDDEKKEILDYFLLNAFNFDISLPEAIFTLLTEYADELEDIAHILNEYSSKASDILDEIDSDDGAHDDEKRQEDSKRKKEFIKILKEFFSKQEIIEFIKTDINELGVNSILYRRILAHKYDIKFSILMRSFDGDLKMIENHNYDYDLEFDYESSSTTVTSETPQEMFILLKKDRFTLLKLDTTKYEAIKVKQVLEAQFEAIYKILNGQSVSKEDNADVSKYLDPLVQKYGRIGSKYLKIFTDDNFLLTNESLIDIILSNFPYTLIKYDRNGATKFLIDDKMEENLAKSSNNPNDVAKYNIHDDQEIREDIKRDLKTLIDIDGITIVKAIAIRLFIDENSQSLHEFSLVLKTILDLMSGQISQKYFLAFLILGNEQDSWSLELALLKFENIYGKIDENLKRKWRINASKIKVKKILELFLEKVTELENTDEKLDENDMNHVIDNMQYFGVDSFNNLQNSNLSSWKLMTTEKYWKKEIEKLKLKKSVKDYYNLEEIFEDLSSKYGTRAKEIMKIIQDKRKELPDIDLRKFLGYINSGVYKIGEETSKIMEQAPVREWDNKLSEYYKTKSGVRKAQDIVRLVEIDEETSKGVKDGIKDIEHQVGEIFEITGRRKMKKIIDFDEDEIKEWIEETRKNSTSKPPITECLAAIVCTFQLKEGITLRDTQLISILTMWNNSNGILMQISTGEGKTFIGVAFVILKVLHDEKVDIITSSSVLAIRDAEENKKYFDFFGISVDHNCHEDIEKRKRAYQCKIVYGVLGNFQRDYLLTEFFDENFMSGHHFKNVLVDEVDSMLLDKGNNILYLSSSLPDIDEIESVFLFIWQYVNEGSSDPEEALKLSNPEVARRTVLENAYGLVEKADIEALKLTINVDDIINKLKTNGIIDEEHTLNDEVYEVAKFDSALKGIDDDSCEKIIALCRNKIESKKQIRIPKYLRKFVQLHLNQWIESAFRATNLRNENEYIVDKSNNGQNKFSDPNVIILDLDTGTDMTNSQWDEGLHQFLQLKHGCRLSLISLKSIFISNVTYFKKYCHIYGMTGTLGNLEERQKTTNIHKIDFVTIPRYMEQRFSEYPSILEKSSSLWLEKILGEVVKIFNDNRSVLIICETIQDTKVIKKILLTNSSVFSEKNVHVYQRDATDFNFGKLEPKHVIVATNLAGRGTDIKLSDRLKKSGGLHVILTYLPQNARIENQAFGRASRAGDMGSARLIIYSESTEMENIAKMKETRNRSELERLEGVNTYYKNFITIEEDFFGKFHAAFRELKKIGNEKSEENQSKPEILSNSFINNYRGFKEAKGTEAMKIYLDNFKLQWSFWLDENSKLLESRRAKEKDMDKIKSDLNNSFQKFVTNAPYIHPIKQTDLFNLHNSENFEKAEGVLMYGDQPDLIAFQYYKCYEMLKKAQIENGNENRVLSKREESELLKCLKMLNNRVNNRNIRIEMANSIKQQYQDSLVSIAAFEKQQKTLNEIDEIFIDSIQALLGRPIMPESLDTTEIKLNIIKNTLHQELIGQSVINKPEIRSNYTDDDIRNVAYNNNIKLEDLKRFLSQNNLNTMKDFTKMLRSSIKLPSREEFWENLKDKGILGDEVQYAIIDMNVLKDLDPSIHEEIGVQFQNKELTVKSKSEIFFANINTINKDQSQYKVELESFKKKISNERFNLLIDNGAIQINKRANFNTQKYEKLKPRKIFDNFDELSRGDFRQICKNYNSIIEKLLKTHEDDRIILTEQSNMFKLNYENIDLIEAPSNENILGDDSIYQEDIYNLIKTKFAYRIALETLARRINENIENEENSDNLVIHLHVSPHVMIVNDLIANNIIKQATCDNEKIENISKIKESLQGKFSGIFSRGPYGFTTNKTNELLTHNLKKALDDLENLKKKIKESVQAFNNLDIHEPDIVLKPLKEYLNKPEQHQMLEFMKLKGFDVVMKVELRKYSPSYWWRFSIVLTIALVQIVAGALLMVLSNGIFYKVGESLIQEGVGDAIFALGTLKSGNFTWKDYLQHKYVSILTTLAMGVARAGLSKLKYLKRFFKETTQINANILSNLSDKATTVTQLIKSGENIGRGTLKTAFKLFASTVTSNVGKAITQAAIGMGADYVMEKFLDETTKRISQYIVEQLQANFFTHNISKTIDSLLLYYSSNDVKEKVLAEFRKICEMHKYWTDIAEKVSNKVDDLIRTGQNISKLITITTSVVSKLLEMSSVTIFALNVYNHLNNSMLDVIKVKKELDKIDCKTRKDDQGKINCETSTDGIQKMKQEILDQIKAQTMEKFKDAINSTVIKPALSFVANAVVKKATNTIKEYAENYKERGYARKAGKIMERAEDGVISEVDVTKVNKILAKSKNPFLHAALVELDVPMNVVGIEAAAVVLKKSLGSDHIINVNYEGRIYQFGDVDSKTAKAVDLDLTKGHFENSKNSVFGNNCMYDALTDKIPGLSDISPNEFRKQVAGAMISEPKVRNSIGSSKNQHFMGIGFYGGAKKDKKPQKSRVYVVGLGTDHGWTGKKDENMIYEFAVGTYNQIKYLTNGRKQIANIDHIPPKSVYDFFKSTNKDMQFVKDLKVGRMPCILIPEEFHLMMGTTGGRTDVRENQIRLMEQGKFASAVLVNFDTYHDTARKYIDKYFRTVEGNTQPKEIRKFRFTGKDDFSSKLKESFINYIDNISTDQKHRRSTRKALISAEQATVLKNYVNNGFNINSEFSPTQEYLRQLDHLYSS